MRSEDIAHKSELTAPVIMLANSYFLITNPLLEERNALKEIGRVMGIEPNEHQIPKMLNSSLAVNFL
jgi:hypothetical protein